MSGLIAGTHLEHVHLPDASFKHDDQTGLSLCRELWSDLNTVRERRVLVSSQLETRGRTNIHSVGCDG
jgi:hypothetical protein